MQEDRVPVWRAPRGTRLDRALRAVSKILTTVLLGLACLLIYELLRLFPKILPDTTTLLVACCIASLALIVWLPKLQLLRVRVDSPLARFTAENEARKTVAALIGGLAIFLGFYSAQQQLALQQQGQFTDRYTKAIAQLAAEDDAHEPELAVRLGGIYALEQIMNSSQEQHYSILEVLCAYIRENSARGPKSPLVGPRADIRVALTVLGRRNRDFEQTYEKKVGWRLLKAVLIDHEFLNAFTVEYVRPRLDLSGSNLTRANLDHLVLPSADLSDTRMSGCSVLFADIRGAAFTRADLSGCIIGSALDEVDFTGSNLEGAVVVGKIAGAQFSGAKVPLSVWFGADFQNPEDIRSASGWENAFYSDHQIAALGLPADHNTVLERKVQARFPGFSIRPLLALSQILKAARQLTDETQAARDRLFQAEPLSPQNKAESSTAALPGRHPK